MKRQNLILLAAFLVPWTGRVLAEEASGDPLEAVRQLTPAEQKFTQVFTNAQLVGRYTTWEDADTPRRDTYTVDKVTKLKGDVWLFVARIQYDEHDVTLPLPLQVKWADDTPVITLDKVPVPGFGVFSARIVVHDRQYAGTWDGGDHGGHMYGRIVPHDKGLHEKKGVNSQESN